MRRSLFASLAVVFLAAILVPPAAAAPIPTTLFYSGDPNGFRPGLFSSGPTVRSYQNFTVSGPDWDVTQLFVRGFFNPSAPASVASANYEIRSGVSVGNGGTVLFSGAAVPVTMTQFGFTYKTIAVDVSFTLNPGVYWMSVTPNPPGGTNFFHAEAEGVNGVGTYTADNEYWCASCGSNFVNPNSFGLVFPAFSSGVNGTLAVPEPSSLVLMLGGLVLLGGVFWQRRRNVSAT